MAQGNAVTKKYTIGEAGRGHSFNSEAEGPIAVSIDGVPLSLLKRTIFAKQIGENIMSVSEAVNQGFSLLFSKAGVALYS